MKRLWWVIPVAAAGAAVVRRSRPAPRARDRAGGRWLTVTVNRPPTDVGHEGKLPPPLQDLAERIDVQIRQAPGNRGTELAARFKEPVPAASASTPARLTGQDPRQELRRALRDAKALLQPAPPPAPNTRPGRPLAITGCPAPEQ
ncbi:hypothetical protein SUDANB1_00846 [Streptomyces sp. enrichment culture]|uniref:hypothetical protein n=1 Tax=Streptomyces sp. enrichment culture TaxID=1795815 RepID=UPI003F57A504